MARPVICQHCRNKFDRDKVLFEKTSKGYYHKECFDTMQKERANRAGIIEFLDAQTPGKVNYPLVQKQIREFTENYNYTESGLLGTLNYMVSVKKIKIQPKTGIAFAPYLYNEARDYYKRLSAMEGIEKVENKEEIVKVEKQESNRLKGLIDVEALLGSMEEGN